MKKLLILLMVAGMFTLFQGVQPMTVDASAPTGTTTINQTITFNGQIDIKVTYPSKIFEGEDLPVTFTFLDGGIIADNIDKLQLQDPTSQWLFVTSFSSSTLQAGETSGTYYFNTSGLPSGPSSNVYGIEGVRYDKIFETNDALATSGAGYFTFEVVSSDTISPIITGGDAVYFADVDNPVTLNAIKLTLSANDETDGNITADLVNITDNYSSNSGTIGDYTTVWEVSDAAGNTSQTTVTVRVVDVDNPVITLNGANTLYLEVHDTYSEYGASVSDNYDSGLAAVITGAVNTGNTGTYHIYYNSTDASGNEAIQLTRTVIIQDTTAPIITLNGGGIVNIDYLGTYSEPGATATDNFDVGPSVSIAGDTVNPNVLGAYTISYTSTDSHGNSNTIYRTVNVVDVTIPEISLNGSPTEYVEFGDAYIELGASASDNYDSSLDVVASDNVNSGVLGTYIVTYDVTDSNGNVAVQVTRTVIIQDTIAPSINGGDTVVFNSQNVQLASILSNITATDVYGGDLTASMIITLDSYTGYETIVGNYSITLQVTDENANTIIKTIEIIVKDDIAPIITISSYLVTTTVADLMTQQEIIEHIQSNQP